MNTLAVFRTFQLGFIVLLMLMVTYCNRLKESDQMISRTAESIPTDTTMVKTP